MFNLEVNFKCAIFSEWNDGLLSVYIYFSIFHKLSMQIIREEEG